MKCFSNCVAWQEMSISCSTRNGWIPHSQSEKTCLLGNTKQFFGSIWTPNWFSLLGESCKRQSVHPCPNLLRVSWTEQFLPRQWDLQSSAIFLKACLSQEGLILWDSTWTQPNPELQNISFFCIWSQTTPWELHLCSQLADKLLFHYNNPSLNVRWNISYSILYPKCRANQMPPHPKLNIHFAPY